MARHFGILNNAADKQPQWHNPEAPMDRDDDGFFYGQEPRRPEPPKEPSLLGSILIVAFVLIVIAFSVYACSGAKAHMHDRPDLNGWFSTLKMPGDTVGCCSYIDGEVLAANEYFILDQAPPSSREKCRPAINRSNEKPEERNEYCVLLFDQWWLVPAKVVLHEPNKYGNALVFGSWGWEGEVGHQRRTVDFFRCFLPGGGA